MLREKTVSTARKSREFIERIIAAETAERDLLHAAMEQFQKENKIIGMEEQSTRHRFGSRGYWLATR